MKNSIPSALLFTGLIFWLLACTGTQTNHGATLPTDSLVLSTTTQSELAQNANTITDLRDGATYATITIGKQTWMAENMRFKAPGSLVNPEYPSTIYGRLYDGSTAQTICPAGWHLPSDEEWNELEIALGLPDEEAKMTGWRGTHGNSMKSKTGWKDELSGTNSSGFNAYPAGFYFEDSFGGLGRSTGFWTAYGVKVDWLATKEEANKKTWVRFLGSRPVGVNRFEDDQLMWHVACRCVKN